MVGYDSDELIVKAGGRYRFVSLVQRRMRELQRGLAPLVERRETFLETAIEELRAGKIWLTAGEEARKLQEASAGQIAAPEAPATTSPAPPADGGVGGAKRRSCGPLARGTGIHPGGCCARNGVLHH